MTAIKERIIEIAKNKGITVGDFAESIDMTYSSFKGNAKYTPLNSDAIVNILTIYKDVSADWLLTGKGAMFVNSQPEAGKEESTPILSQNNEKGVPYYDVDFVGGFDLMTNDQTVVPLYNIIFKPLEDAQLWCNMTGNSMIPKINPGDIMALKEVHSLDDILFGEIYAVVLDGFRTVKIIRKSNKPDMLRFIPINKEDFDEQEFEKKRILKVFAVLGSIQKFF